MSSRKRRSDHTAGPIDAEDSGSGMPDGQPMPEDDAETDGEKLARETERGLDRALNRIPAG
jgi:hypothetical protein